MYVYTVEFYPAKKRSDTLTYATTRMSREHILLSEEKQTQRARHCRTPLRQGITQATKPQSLDSVIGP